MPVRKFLIIKLNRIQPMRVDDQRTPPRRTTHEIVASIPNDDAEVVLPSKVDTSLDVVCRLGKNGVRREEALETLIRTSGWRTAPPGEVGLARVVGEVGCHRNGRLIGPALFSIGAEMGHRQRDLHPRGVCPLGCHLGALGRICCGNPVEAGIAHSAGRDHLDEAAADRLVERRPFLCRGPAGVDGGAFALRRCRRRRRAVACQGLVPVARQGQGGRENGSPLHVFGRGNKERVTG